MKRLLTLAAVMVMTAGLSGAAVITVFSGAAGQTNWQAAVGSFTTFSFTGNFNANVGPTTISPLQSGNNNYSGLDPVANNYKDVLVTGFVPNASDPSLLAVSSTTYTWKNGAAVLPMTAVGGIWDTTPLLAGGGIIFTANLQGGGSQTITTFNTTGSGQSIFIGWISDIPFTSFTLSTTANDADNVGRPYGREHYTLDDLKIGGGAAGVPEPATLSMVGIALLGLGALRRYRRS